MDDLKKIVNAIRKRLADPEKRTDADAPTRLYPTATHEQLQVAEDQLGRELPPVLKRLYSEISNGGFGPGYGLAGVAGYDPCGTDRDIVAMYQEQSSAEWKIRFPEWPPHIVRICYLGCEVYAAIDFSSSDYNVFHFDAVLEGVEVEGEPDIYFRNCLTPYDTSLYDWLYLWAKGIDVQQPPDLTTEFEKNEIWRVVIHKPGKTTKVNSWRAAREYKPEPIGSRTEIIQRIIEVAPSAKFPDPISGVIEGSDFFIEIGLGEDEELHYIVLSVQGSEAGAEVVADIMRHLNLPAFEPEGTAKNFKPDSAIQLYNKWRAAQVRIYNEWRATRHKD